MWQNYNTQPERQISIFNSTADTIAKLNKLLDEATEETRKGQLLKWYHTLGSIYMILESAMEKIDDKKRKDYTEELKKTDDEIRNILKNAYIQRKNGKKPTGTASKIKNQLEKKELTLRRIREEVGLGISFKGTEEDEMD